MRKPDFFKNVPTTKASRKHEESVQKRSGAFGVPGSGNKPMNPGDVKGSRFLRECKTTSKGGFLVSHVILSKLCKEAVSQMRDPLLEIEIRGSKAPVPSQWVMMPADLFEELFGGEGR